LSLAAWARRERPGRHQFRLFDTYFLKPGGLAEVLRAFDPKVVALSALTTSAQHIPPVVAQIRQALGDNVWVLLGGPHATAYPEEALAIPGLDGLVTGEGEIPFVQYLDYVEGLRPLSKVQGLVYRRNGAAIFNPPAPSIMNLDDLPTPAYDLCDMGRVEAAHPIISMIPPPHRCLPVVTSRGCLFSCTFCHQIFGRKWRARSAERVLDDLEGLVRQYGVRQFDIVDDIFNGSHRRALDICRGIVRRRLDVRLYFPNGLRFDMLDRPLLEAMREAGTVFMCAAFEAASPRIQREMNKFVDIEKTLENVAFADELGIFVKGFFILGTPGETRDEMILTIRTAEASRLHFALFFLLNPLRGTAIGERLAARGVNVSPEHLGGYFSRRTNYSGLPDDELDALVRQAYRCFWTPARILATLARYPAPGAALQTLARPTVYLQLYEVFRRVFGMGQSEATVGRTFRVPSPLPAALESALGYVGVAGREVAEALYGQLPRGPVVPDDLKGRVGLPRSRRDAAGIGANARKTFAF
jgi:radical SAM superfamily enzyme YgiQ (UPF0313 family)